MTLPLVSCLMPTSVRLDCVAEALAWFLKQDYPARELLILNDGPGRMLTTDQPGVRMIDADIATAGLSEKIARLVAAARGELIAFWPEESVSLPWRLSCSVDRLLQSDAGGDWPAEYWAYWAREELQSLNAVADWAGLAGGLFRRELWSASGERDAPTEEAGTAGELFIPNGLGRLCPRSSIPFADRFLVLRTPLSLRGGDRSAGRALPDSVELIPREINDPVLAAAVERLQRRKVAADRHRRFSLRTPADAGEERGLDASLVWLDARTPDEAAVGYGALGTGGELGYESRTVEIGGRQLSHSLSAHGPSRLEFDLGADFRELRCRVAINDDVPAGATAADFLVLGDGRPLAIAAGVRPQQAPRWLTADVTGVRRLELVVRPQRWDWCHAVWVDPVLAALTTGAQPDPVVDSLGRAEIRIPEGLPAAELCVATVGSPGYESWLDDLLGSIRSRGRLGDALLAVFFFGKSPTIAAIAEKHGAFVVPCFELLPVTAASKAVLYSVARVIRAEKYLCLDADLLVLDDLRPLVDTLNSVAPDAILAGRDATMVCPLERQLTLQYGGQASDLSRLVAGDATYAARSPLVVSDRMFAGSQLALNGLDHQLRSFVDAIDWVDRRRSAKPARSRFVFNLALAQSGSLVELAPRYLRSFSELTPERAGESRKMAGPVNGPEATVVHAPRFGEHHNPHVTRQFREEFRRAGRLPQVPAAIPVLPEITSAAIVRASDPSTPAAPVGEVAQGSLSLLPSDPLACAVIIPCHNYGRFLGECLDSVLAQTRPAAEILVVLDDCSDNSADVAQSYCNHGVRTLTVRCCDTYLTRRAGLRATQAPIVCFLDADDRLSTNYLAAGLPLFMRPAVGIVTAPIQEFGNSSEVWSPEPCNLEEGNFVCSAAIVRRLALDGTRAFDQLEGIGIFGEDWFVWRRLASAGWEIARSDGVQHYRRHDDNITLDCPEPWADRYRTQSRRQVPSKLRVGFVTDWLVVGGVSRHLQLLTRYARNLEWVGTVVADSGCTDDDTVAATQAIMPVFAGINHVEARRNSSLPERRASAAEALAELLPRVDVLYANGFGFGRLLAPVAGRVPIVYALHSSGRWAAEGAAEVSLLAASLVGVAEVCRECLPSAQQRQMRTIPNGVDFAELAPREPRWLVRQRWGLSHDALAVGFVGRWSPEKNPWAVAEAVAALGPTATAVYCSPHCRSDEPPLDAAERQRVTELTEGRVIWTWSASMGEIYRALDCLVVPSHVEGDPLVAIEAFGTGCPLVATSVGSLPDLPVGSERLFVPVAHSPTGVELAYAVREAIAPENVATVERARSYAWEQRGAKRMAQEWESVFQRVAERSDAD